jgi:hypothetical protein
MDNIIRDIWPLALLIAAGVLAYMIKGQIKLAKANEEREKRERIEASIRTGEWRK